MKTNRIVMALLVSVLVFGCKDRTNGPVEDVVEDYTVNRLPNTSDEHFQKALANLENSKGNEAAVNIDQGIAELEKEGADIKGRSKTDLGKATEILKKISTDLKADKKVPASSLREVIANAEINIAHDYLTTDDFYVLDEPEEYLNRTNMKKFNHNLSSLKKEEGKMKGEAKKDGEALLNEGKKLDAEFQAWQQKAVDYTKKSGEHLKKYYPEYYGEGYYWIL